jgi:hypothetical protein
MYSTPKHYSTLPHYHPLRPVCQAVVHLATHRRWRSADPGLPLYILPNCHATSAGQEKQRALVGLTRCIPKGESHGEWCKWRAGGGSRGAIKDQPERECGPRIDKDKECVTISNSSRSKRACTVWLAGYRTLVDLAGAGDAGDAGKDMGHFSNFNSSRTTTSQSEYIFLTYNGANGVDNLQTSSERYCLPVWL